jgi:hypothetical protein
MPQEKPTRGARFLGEPLGKVGKQSTFKEAVNGTDMSPLFSGQSNVETYGAQAQLDRKRADKYYKANPAARQYGMAKAAAASKANGPKASGQAKTAALQREMARGTEKARDYNDIVKMGNDPDKRSLQFEMDDAKVAAEDRSAKRLAKSPATIQKGMAESTRKTQAASAAAKKSTPVSPMRKLLKIK